MKRFLAATMLAAAAFLGFVSMAHADEVVVEHHEPRHEVVVRHPHRRHRHVVVDHHTDVVVHAH